MADKSIQLGGGGSPASGDVYFSATDRVLGRSSAGAGLGELITCTAAARALLDDADAAAMRASLGLGTAAVVNTGVANGNVPAMDAVGYPAASGAQITALAAANVTAAGTFPAEQITAPALATAVPNYIPSYADFGIKYRCTSYIGGAAGALDVIDAAICSDGEKAIVVEADGSWAIYDFNNVRGASKFAEAQMHANYTDSICSVVQPDTDTGGLKPNARWELIEGYCNAVHTYFHARQNLALINRTGISTQLIVNLPVGLGTKNLAYGVATATASGGAYYYNGVFSPNTKITGLTNGTAAAEAQAFGQRVTTASPIEFGVINIAAGTTSGLMTRMAGGTFFVADRAGSVTGLSFVLKGFITAGTLTGKIWINGAASVATSLDLTAERTYKINNDGGGQIIGLSAVTGINTAEVDAEQKCHISIVSDGGGFYHLEWYADAARTDLRAHTATYNTSGAKALVADGASTLGGTITVGGTFGADVDISVKILDYAYASCAAATTNLTFLAGGVIEPRYTFSGGATPDGSIDIDCRVLVVLNT